MDDGQLIPLEYQRARQLVLTVDGAWAIGTFRSRLSTPWRASRLSWGDATGGQAQILLKNKEKGSSDFGPRCLNQPLKNMLVDSQYLHVPYARHGFPKWPKLTRQIVSQTTRLPLVRVRVSSGQGLR